MTRINARGGEGGVMDWIESYLDATWAGERGKAWAQVVAKLRAAHEAGCEHKAALAEAHKALAGLLGNKHINLGDMIYHVREAEGLGWDGPSVTAWNQAVMEAQRILKAIAEGKEAT